MPHTPLTGARLIASLRKVRTGTAAGLDG